MSKVAFLTTIFPMDELFLHDFFTSLSNQTYTQFDLIVLNDGYKNFEEIKKKYNHLKIIELKHNKTPAKNREYGINYCIENEYDILIFGDSDDCFAANRIEKSIQLLEHNDIIVNDLSLFDDNGINIEKYMSHRLKNLQKIEVEFIEDKNIFGFTNTALNLKQVEKIDFDTDIVAADWFFYKKLLRKNMTAIFTNETISYYRQHDNNLVGLTVKDCSYCFWWERK